MAVGEDTAASLGRAAQLRGSGAVLLGPGTPPSYFPCLSFIYLFFVEFKN